MRLALLILAALAVAVSGCASRASVRQLHADLIALRAEIAVLRDAHEQTEQETAGMLDATRALQGEVRELVTQLADTVTELQRLRAQLVQAEEALKRVRSELDARAQPVVTSVVLPAAPSTAPTGERPARDQAPRQGSPDVSYGTALATFRAREHGQAVLEFLDFIARYPKHLLAANAQYWIGEAYYAQRDYRQALLEFQKVFEFNPGSGKAADTLLKIGMCHANLRDASQAHRTWQRLITQYPDSESAARARAFIRNRRAAVAQ